MRDKKEKKGSPKKKERKKSGEKKGVGNKKLGGEGKGGSLCSTLSLLRRQRGRKFDVSRAEQRLTIVLWFFFAKKKSVH